VERSRSVARTTLAGPAEPETTDATPKEARIRTTAQAAYISREAGEASATLALQAALAAFKDRNSKLARAGQRKKRVVSYLSEL
jgi:hypothetical protein